MIAVFWIRIGSPTGHADSGTVEEIEKHIKSGKPAMLYFSNVPVRRDSVDEKQYSALRVFRADFQKRGLIATFDSVEDFRDKLNRQLAQTVLKFFGHFASGDTSGQPAPFSTVRRLSLGNTARQLLSELAQDRNGILLMVGADDGLVVQTNGK